MWYRQKQRAAGRRALRISGARRAEADFATDYIWSPSSGLHKAHTRPHGAPCVLRRIFLMLPCWAITQVRRRKLRCSVELDLVLMRLSV